MKDSILIISDVHHKTHIVDQILNLEVGNYNKVVCAGDIFDDFGDTVEDSTVSAKWFVEKINDPKWTMLRSNHSISYEFSFNKHCHCSGFTAEKSVAINKIVSRDDWGKQKTFHYENGVLFTHAGLGSGFLKMMVDKGYCEPCEWSMENIQKNLLIWDKVGLEKCSVGQEHHIFGAGYDRCGGQSYGGPIWIDFSSIGNITGIQQICFHTPSIFPVLKYVRSDSKNITQDVNSPILKKTKVNFDAGVCYGLDTHLNHYAILSDKGIEIYEILFELPRNKTKKREHKIVEKNSIYRKDFSFVE